MLRILQQTEISFFHIVVAPGCDGHASFGRLLEKLGMDFNQKVFLGRFPITAMIPDFKDLGGWLTKGKTPQIIVAAAEGRLEKTPEGRVVVPRLKRPEVPREWFLQAYVFETNRVAERWYTGYRHRLSSR